MKYSMCAEEAPAQDNLDKKKRGRLLLAVLMILVLTSFPVVLHALCPRCLQTTVTETAVDEVQVTSCPSCLPSIDYSFVAYRKNDGIVTTFRTPQDMDDNLKLDLKLDGIHQLQYPLTQGSQLSVTLCSTVPGASFYFARIDDVYRNVLKNMKDDGQQQGKTTNAGNSGDNNFIKGSKKEFLGFQKVPSSSSNYRSCGLDSARAHFKFNATSDGFYLMLIRHKGPAPKNTVHIRTFFNSTDYPFTNEETTVAICKESLFRFSCVMSLKAVLIFQHYVFKMPPLSAEDPDVLNVKFLFTLNSFYFVPMIGVMVILFLTYAVLLAVKVAMMLRKTHNATRCMYIFSKDTVFKKGKCIAKFRIRKSYSPEELKDVVENIVKKIQDYKKSELPAEKQSVDCSAEEGVPPSDLNLNVVIY